MLAQGLGTETIVERLVITQTTARNHIQRIMDKLRAHTRMEAVVTGTRRGLTPGIHQAS